MSSLITKEEIDAVVQQRNKLIRNLQITLGYYKVGRAMRKLLGSSEVNWFGFGAFASKTAGQGLRHELLPGPLKSAMIRSAGYDNTQVYFRDVLGPADVPISKSPHTLLAEVLTQVSLLLSKGNLMIFSEVAWPFIDMVNTFSKDWLPDRTKLNFFLDNHFVPGTIENGGQDVLRESFVNFYEARFETNTKKKAELVYLANLLVGFHEQSRLQPVIEKAISVPFDTLTKGIIPEESEHPESIRQKLAKRTVGFSRQMVLRAVTRMWMTYALPTRELNVGKDLVAPTGLINFPKELRTIENPRCKELIQKFDSSQDTISGSAAGNWGSLYDRMHFLATFFRSYQRYEPLFEKPFLESQIAEIEAGRFPQGPL